MKRKQKTKLWNFRATAELIARLERASILTDKPASQIAREAINEKLNELAQEFPGIDKTAKAKPQEAAAATV